MNKFYDVEYSQLSDGTIYVMYRSHDDDDNRYKPVYTALKQDMATAISYIDNLNKEG